MGSKGGKTVILPQAQAQTSTVAPNPVALAAYQNVVGQAQDLQGQHIGFTPDQQRAFGEVNQLQGAANPYIDQAAYSSLQGLNAGNALIQQGANAGSPQNFGYNINSYMSPYLNDVVKATMANINETNAQQQSQLTGNAIAQSAMGGNRVGVAGAELARQQNLTNNSTLANILQAGYGQAGQNLFQNAGLNMQAGNSLGMLGNQTAGIYSGLGNEALSTGLQGANALLQTGGMQQALPYQQLGWLSGIVGNQGPNMGQTGSQNSMGYTSQYAPSPNPLNSILGAGVAAAGALLPMSDRRAKEDVREIGKLHDGQKIYRFRYKGHPEHQVGLMAQEVERRHPEAVGERNGLKTVDYHEATKDAVRKAHGGGLGEYDPSADDYDSPVGGGFGAIPQVKPTNPHGLQLPAFLAMQQAHQGQQEQGKDPSFGDWGKAGKGLGGAYDRYADRSAMDSFASDYASEPDLSSYLGEWRGGRVRGYDEGGAVDDYSSDDDASGLDALSDEGGVRAPRSVRNNNPGNLVDNDYTRGLPGYKGGDGRFAIFESPEAGMAAQDANLQGYGRKGFNTPSAIIGRWAPAKENGVEATNRYIKHLSTRLGIDPNTPLDLNDPNVRSNVRSAMADWEAGTDGQTKPMAYATSGGGSGGGLGAINSAAPVAEGRSADTGVAPPNAEPGFLERLGVPKISPDTRAALISAGLGMMASKSHWLGPAIGEGGLAGVKTYYENQQNARQNANTQSEIANRAGLLGVAQQRNKLTGQHLGLTAEQIRQQGEYQRGQLGLGTRKQDLEERLTNIRIKAAQDAAAALRDAYTPQSGAGPLPSGAPTAGGSQSPSSPPPPANTVGTQGTQLHPASDPAHLDNLASRYEQGALAAGAAGDTAAQDSYLKAAQGFRQQAQTIRQSGKATAVTGETVSLPGAPETEYQLAGAKSKGEAAGKAPYEIKEVAGPNGETYYKSVADIVDENGKAQATPITSSAGAGTPTSGPPQPNLVMAKQPAVMAKRQEAIATNEQKMTDSYQARQIARERYQTLADILSKYQTGKFAENKASMVAALRGVGIPVTNKDTANPAAFEQFTKNAMKNVFSDVHDLGGRILVAEITGLQRSTANPDLQPEANKAILGQAIGLLNYEDQYHDDYFNWKRQNPYAADTSAFDTAWVKAHPIKEFVNAATGKIGALGEQIPAPADRKEGHVYSIPENKATGTKARPMQWRNGKWFPPPTGNE